MKLTFGRYWGQIYIKKLLSQLKKQRNSVFWHLSNGSSESKNPYNFLKKLNKIFLMHVNILSKLWLIFCCHQQKIQKCAIFDILMTITSAENIIRRTTPFLSSTFWSVSIGLFHFCISKPAKFSSVGSPLYIMF